MATILFFEKPGCRNNTRQKALLVAAGHEVIARNLLREPWTEERLRPFFGARPIALWFNPSAPRIKSGEVKPETLDEQAALAAMLADPLLIRRPLMEVGNRREVGFDPALIVDWIGLTLLEPMEACPRTDGHCSP